MLSFICILQSVNFGFGFVACEHLQNLGQSGAITHKMSLCEIAAFICGIEMHTMFVSFILLDFFTNYNQIHCSWTIAKGKVINPLVADPLNIVDFSH